MPASSFREYVEGVEDILNATVASGQAVVVSLQIDHRSLSRGYIAGSLQFLDGSELHFREFVDFTVAETHEMYAYHYQDADKELVFRYDNARHQPPLSQSEHKHTRDGISITPAPTLSEVLLEIEDLLFGGAKR